MAEQAAVVKKSGIGKKIAIVLFVLFALVVIGVVIALGTLAGSALTLAPLPWSPLMKCRR
mgnify:CR=1 FL=1